MKVMHAAAAAVTAVTACMSPIRLYDPLSPGDADHDASLLLSIAAVILSFVAHGLRQLPCSSVNSLWLVMDDAWPIWPKRPQVCQSCSTTGHFAADIKVGQIQV